MQFSWQSAISQAKSPGLSLLALPKPCVIMHACTQEVEQGHPQLHRKFEANLGLVRPCFFFFKKKILKYKGENAMCCEPCPLLNRQKGGVEQGKGGREEVVGRDQGERREGNLQSGCKIHLRKGWDRLQNHLKSLVFQFSLLISHPTTRQIFNLRENNTKEAHNNKADCT